MAEDLLEPTASTDPPVLDLERVDPAVAVNALDEVTAVWAAPTEPTLIAVGRSRTITGIGEDRFETVRTTARDLFESLGEYPRIARPRLFGGASFFPETTLEPPWTDFDPAAFTLPVQQVVITADRTLLSGVDTTREEVARTARTLREATRLDEPSQLVTGPDVGRSSGTATLRTDPETWKSRVGSVTRRIRDTGLEKAVLAAAADLPLEADLDLGAVLEALRDRYPGCYRFAFQGRDGNESTATFFGASPERLVGKRGNRLETEALAGTVRRGDDEVEDREHIRHLETDDTIGREHAVVADRIREQLAGVGARVDVGEREVHSLANVHHLRTPIAARLPKERHVLELVELLHPTPALGGHPSGPAQELIAAVEPTARGWYGGPVGWFDAAGDGTFAVGIRSAVARDRQATLFAGNGIVAGSDPETEYRELDAKFEPIRGVL
ncbi:MAG: isochorismate synthase [Halodesulfurarchaeum sp.]